MNTILDGIIIGAAGGAAAGIVVYAFGYGHNKLVERVEKNRVYNWLEKNTTNENGNKYRSTRAIASWNNLTEDRVRYICSIHKKIYLSTGKEEDRWSLYERSDRSIYEDRGLRTI
jgi:hypothetical protein